MKHLGVAKIRHRLRLDGTCVSSGVRKAPGTTESDPTSKRSNRHYIAAEARLSNTDFSKAMMKKEDEDYKKLQKWILGAISTLGPDFDFKEEVFASQSKHLLWQTVLKLILSFPEWSSFVTRRLMNNEHRSHLRTTLAIHNLVEKASGTWSNRIGRANKNPGVNPNVTEQWKHPYPSGIRFQVFVLKPENFSLAVPYVRIPTLPIVRQLLINWQESIEPITTYEYQLDQGFAVSITSDGVLTLETFLDQLRSALNNLWGVREGEPSVKRLWLYNGAFDDTQYPEVPFTKTEITNEYTFYRAVTQNLHFINSRSDGYFFKAVFHHRGLGPVLNTPRHLPLQRYTTFDAYQSSSQIKLSSDVDKPARSVVPPREWYPVLGYPPRIFNERKPKAPKPCPVERQLTSESEPDSEEERDAIYDAHRNRWTAESRFMVERDTHSFVYWHRDELGDLDDDIWNEGIRAGEFRNMSEEDKEALRTGNWDRLPVTEKELMRLSRWGDLPQAEKDLMKADPARFKDLPFQVQEDMLDAHLEQAQYFPPNEMLAVVWFSELTDVERRAKRLDGEAWYDLPFDERENMRRERWDILPENVKDFYLRRNRGPAP